MPSAPFPNLLSTLTIRGVTLKNRILSTGHMTMLVTDGIPNDDQVAYHEARATGGAGLLVVEAAAVHTTAVRGGHVVSAATDACIPGYRRIVEACRPHDCVVFGQLFHPGREMRALPDGSLPVACAPSDTPNDRFLVTPAPMSRQLIADVIAGYGDAASRMQCAGLQGVEIVASMGYLPAQFLNPRVNRRTDEYGGSLENRLRFLREISADIRAKTGNDMVIGIRISGDEMSHDGLSTVEVLAVCEALDRDGLIDYYSVIAGSSADVAGSIHLVPPLPYGTASRNRCSLQVGSTNHRSPSSCWRTVTPICAA